MENDIPKKGRSNESEQNICKSVVYLLVKPIRRRYYS